MKKLASDQIDDDFMRRLGAKRVEPNPNCTHHHSVLISTLTGPPVVLCMDCGQRRPAEPAP